MDKYSIVLVGCGATGSNIATFVSQLAISEQKINEIILIDGDVVEAKNFRNQKYTLKDLGRNKAQVLANRYFKLGINVTYVDRYLRDKEELINIMTRGMGTTILIGAVDNNNARRIMHETFHDNRIRRLIYIDTGNGEGDDRFGQTICGSKYQGKIITPPVGDICPQIFNEEEVVEEVKPSFKCSEIEEHPQHFATNILSATTTFLMINNIICLNKVGSTMALFNSDKVEIKQGFRNR